MKTFILSCLLLISLIAQAQKAAIETYDLEAFVTSEAQRNNIAAMAAGIIRDGKLVWAKGFGASQQGIETTEETLFIASSIAKLVVAVAVMQQVELGKIDLDKDISTYLGYTLRNTNYPDKILTARLLMTHQAGLANPTTEEADINSFHADSTIDMKVWIKKYLVPGEPKYNPSLWLKVQPGTTHLSSNLGMTLLAHLIEVISGEDFRAYCDQHIFGPLGMKYTSYHMNKQGSYPEELLADVVRNDGRINPSYFESPIYPAGLLRTSVKEWSIFMIAMMNGGHYEGNTILKETSVRDMLDIRYPDANLAYGAGVGLIWRAVGKNKEWIGHTGGGMITASADLNLEARSAVIIFTNMRGKKVVTPDVASGTIYYRLHEEALK